MRGIRKGKEREENERMKRDREKEIHLNVVFLITNKCT